MSIVGHKFSDSEILELFYAFAPAFVQVTYTIGDKRLHIDALVENRMYWFVKVCSEDAFPAVSVDLVQITAILDDIIEGISLQNENPVRYHLTDFYIFPAQLRRPYMAAEPILRTVDDSLKIDFLDGRLSPDLYYTAGLAEADESNMISEYPKKSCSFKRCTALELRKGSWYVAAGHFAEPGIYGDGRFRARLSHFGYYAQCAGFAYIDVPMEASNWDEYVAWKRQEKQEKEVNIFSIEPSLEYAGKITQLMCWLKDHTKDQANLSVIYDSLADVPEEILNPEAKIRAKRIWVMLSGSSNEKSSVLCLHTGELSDVGERLALYQIDKNTIKKTTCTLCHQGYFSLNGAALCSACLNIETIKERVPSKLYYWLQLLRDKQGIDLEEIYNNENIGYWVCHMFSRDPSAFIIPDCLREVSSSIKNVKEYVWNDAHRMVKLRVMFDEIGDFLDDTTDYLIKNIELWSYPVDGEPSQQSVFTPALLG